MKKKFLKISQNSQQNACARVCFLIKLQFSCGFIKKGALGQNTFLWNALSGCFLTMFSFGLSSVISKVSVAEF